VRGDLKVEDYSLQRNKHYLVMATIRSEGEIVYMPDVRYRVLDWEDATGGFDIGKSITFDSRWAPGTPYSGNNVAVYNHGILEYKFTLTRPAGAVWSAVLTNPFDFEFDYSGDAVSNGVTAEAVERTIRIRPRRETSQNGIRTEFYITVKNGTQFVELDLPNDLVGGGNRYVITQIPN